MLQKLTASLAQRLRDEKDEDGIALITLIGMSIIMFVVAATITTSTTMSVFSTNMQMSQQQARNNAESALDLAEASYNSGNTYIGLSNSGNDTRIFCQSGYTYEHDDYSFEIFSTNSNMPEDSNDNSLRSGCPSANDTWYLIKGTGYGNNNTTSVVSRVYKNLDYDTRFVPGNKVITAGEVNLRETGDITIGSTIGVDMHPSIAAADTVACENSGDFPHNINAHVASAGNIALGSDCIIEGDAIVSGNIDVRTAISGDTCIQGNGNEASHLSQGETHCGNYDISMAGYEIPTLSDAVGFDTVEVSGGASDLKPLIEGATSPRIIDARNFTSPAEERISNQNITVDTDVVVVLRNGFNVNNMNIKAGEDGGSLSFVFEGNNSSTNEFSNVVYEAGATGAIAIESGGGNLILRNTSLNGWVGLPSSANVDIRGDSSILHYPVGLPVSSSYSPDFTGDSAQKEFPMPSVRVK